MDVAIRTSSHPVDAKTGLTLPLRTFLGSRDLQMHRASIAVELEAVSKKCDRFGWDRDRGTAAHDRIITDWMDALQDYPLDEIRAACREAIIANPNRMPNEGHIVAQIKAARAKRVAALPKQHETHQDRRPVSKDEANAILERCGFTARRMRQ